MYICLQSGNKIIIIIKAFDYVRRDILLLARGIKFSRFCCREMEWSFVWVILYKNITDNNVQ